MENRIFISCVSAEMGDIRQSLRRHLVAADCDVKVQEDFCQTAEDTLEKLDAYIRESQAIIHLIGAAAGAVAHPSAVRSYLESIKRDGGFLAHHPALRAALGDFFDITYTQWEAFIALHHKRPLFVYSASEPLSQSFTATGEKEAGQKRHRERLILGRRHPVAFTSREDLFGQLIGDLRKIIPRLPALMTISLGRIPVPANTSVFEGLPRRPACSTMPGPKAPPRSCSWRPTAA